MQKLWFQYFQKKMSLIRAVFQFSPLLKIISIFPPKSLKTSLFSSFYFHSWPFSLIAHNPKRFYDCPSIHQKANSNLELIRRLWANIKQYSKIYSTSSTNSYSVPFRVFFYDRRYLNGGKKASIIMAEFKPITKGRLINFPRNLASCIHAYSRSSWQYCGHIFSLSVVAVINNS